jgi:hypothetical protein
MYWADGSIYRGFWENGVQSGLGLMIFKDGLRKAGFFEDNIYKKPLRNMEEYEEYDNKKKKVPEAFRQEIKEYVGLQQDDNDDNDDMYIGQAFNTMENEDLMATNQFENMQEMANAPFGPNMNISKEEYAK